MPRAVSTHAAPVALLRVLLVEDCAADADLIVHRLRQSGFEPSCLTVDTESAYLAHLTADLDLIVADYTLPGFDAARALTLARERGFDIPFIIVSGTIDEEQAVAAMKSGAADYLSKDRLARLGQAVHHAIDAAALRRAAACAEHTVRSCAAILDVALDGIFIVDESDTITEFNRAAEQMFGRSRADAIGRPLGDLLEPLPPVSSAGAVAGPRRITATVEPGRRVEMTARRADGSCFPVELAVSKLPATGPSQFAGLLRDIGERKSREAAALERNRLSGFARDVGIAFAESGSLMAMLELCVQLMVAHLGVALAQIWTSPPNEDRLQLLASAGDLAAAPGAEPAAHPMFFTLDDVVRGRRTVATNAVLADRRVDHQWAAANGIVSFVGYPLIVGERVVGAIAMFGRGPLSEATVQAIAYIANAVASAIERDRSEAAQARLAAIIEATTDLVFIRMLDHNGPTYLNRAGRTMLGLGPEEPVPDLSGFRSEDFGSKWTDVILPAALKDGLWAGETAFVSRDGRVTPVSQLLLAHPTHDGAIQLSTIARDITDRRRSAAELRASDERTRFALEAAGMGVWEYDVRSRHVTWTEMRTPDAGRRAGRFAGTAEEFFAATHADDRDTLKHEVERAIVARRDLAIVFRTITPKGETRWVECRGRVLCEAGLSPTRLVGVSTDVTERKLLEAQFRQAQKMEAIGQLAGGVAHDFNNLLTAILGYAKFAADSLPQTDQCRSDIEEVIKAAHRAAALTKQLLAFSRTQVLQSTLVDVNVLVTGVSDMFRRLIGEHIALDLVLADDLALVRADAGQLEQVVMNLVVNARDAMERGGRLTIKTANVQLHASSGLPQQVVLPGWYVRLTVADDGIGMDEQTKRHLFEPFFTTKERGKGTGLGLATVYGIVKQSDGYIWVDSEPGRGSTFTVYLPRTERQADAVMPAAAPLPGHHSSETVLLVEDEAGVRHLARRMLEGAGFRVLDAASGPDAEVMFARHRGSIDLLVTDVVMPGMSGPDLFRRLAIEQPGLKVVYISGYATEAMARQLKVDRGQPHVQKPFTADQLVSYVRGVIDGRPAPESKGPE